MFIASSGSTHLKQNILESDTGLVFSTIHQHLFFQGRVRRTKSMPEIRSDGDFFQLSIPSGFYSHVNTSLPNLPSPISLKSVDSKQPNVRKEKRRAVARPRQTKTNPNSSKIKRQVTFDLEEDPINQASETSRKPFLPQEPIYAIHPSHIPLSSMNIPSVSQSDNFSSVSTPSTISATTVLSSFSSASSPGIHSQNVIYVHKNDISRIPFGQPITLPLTSRTLFDPKSSIPPSNRGSAASSTTTSSATRKRMGAKTSPFIDRESIDKIYKIMQNAYSNDPTQTIEDAQKATTKFISNLGYEDSIIDRHLNIIQQYAELLKRGTADEKKAARKQFTRKVLKKLK
jgi:hypothetical protein